MKGIYLFSGQAEHPEFNLDYCDIDNKSNANLKCSAFDIDISKYDFIIASPPCNYWSRALGNKKPSIYAEQTKEFLTWCITELPKYNKPLLIENVRNQKKFDKYGILSLASENGLYYQFVGRHTYFTNQFINLSCKQKKDFKYGGKRLVTFNESIGGNNVHNVVDIFLNFIHTNNNGLSSDLEENSNYFEED